jgi:hypothetical protein
MLIVDKQYMNKLNLFLFSILTLFLISDVTLAEIPSEVSLRYQVTRIVREKVDGARHRMVVIGDKVLGVNERCEVTFRACGQRFVPSTNPPNPELRQCEPFEIGVAEFGPGEGRVTVRSRSRIMQRAQNSGRQLSVQAQLECVNTEDLENATVLTTKPRARMLSANDEPVGVGASIPRVISQISRNFNQL